MKALQVHNMYLSCWFMI